MSVLLLLALIQLFFPLVNTLQRLKVSEACKHSCNLYPAGAGRGNLSVLFAAGCN